MADSGVVVKNTFLEVGDHKSLLERSDGWRRQMSEPVKVYTDPGQVFHHADFSEPDDDLLLGNTMPEMDTRTTLAPSLHAQAVGSSMPMSSETASPGSIGLMQQSAGGKPPKVLLLSESIPAKRGGQKERDKKGARDGHINQMKDNSITKKEPPWTGVTTVMMRNLPNKYTQQMLLEELQDGGFRVLHDFDFFYLPMDHSNAANLGYCFINFVETALANAFAAAFQGKKMRRFNSNKTVVVMPASVQGYDRNYAYYASTRVVQAEDPQYRPLFLRLPSEHNQVSREAPLISSVGQRGTGKGRGGGGKAGGSSSGSSGCLPKGGEKGGARGKGAKGGGMPGLAGGMGRGPDMMPQEPSNPVMQGVQDWMANAAMTSGWSGVVPAPDVPAQPRRCPACGAEVSPTHRFCAFCGADQTAWSNIQSLRADAPAFTPTVSSSYPSAGPAIAPDAGSLHMPGQGPGLEPGEPWQALSGALRSPEVITDELDVMRGRMVLLAALKDMEERESMGAEAPARGAGNASALSATGIHPQMSASGAMGGCADFFSVLDR